MSKVSKGRIMKPKLVLYNRLSISKSTSLSNLLTRYKKMNCKLAKALAAKKRENRMLTSLLDECMSVIHQVFDNALSTNSLIRDVVEKCNKVKTRPGKPVFPPDSGKEEFESKFPIDVPPHATATAKAVNIVNSLSDEGSSNSSPNKSHKHVKNTELSDSLKALLRKRHPFKNCVLNNELWRDWSWPSFLKQSLDGRSSISSSGGDAEVESSSRNGVDPTKIAQTDSDESEAFHPPSPDRCRFVSQRRGPSTHKSLRYDCDDDDVDEEDTLLLKIQRSPPLRPKNSLPTENTSGDVKDLIKDVPVDDPVARQSVSSSGSPLFATKKCKRVRFRYTNSSSDETLVVEEQSKNDDQPTTKPTPWRLEDILNSPGSRNLNAELQKLAASVTRKFDEQETESDATITGPFRKSELEMVKAKKAETIRKDQEPPSTSMS